MNYEIKIGTQKNFTTLMDEPLHKIMVSEDTYNIIKMFANVRKDANLNSIYTINDIDFTMNPILQ